MTVRPFFALIATFAVVGCSSSADTSAEDDSDATVDPIIGMWAATSLTIEDGTIEAQPERDPDSADENYEELEIEMDFTGRHIAVEIEEDSSEPDGLYVERGTSSLTVTARGDGDYDMAVVPYANGRMDMDCTLSTDTLSCTVDQQIDGFIKVIGSTWARADQLASDALVVDDEF